MTYMKLRKAFLCLSLLGAFSAQADSVTRDLSNGDWVYQLSNPDNINEQIEWRYTPRNQVDPKIKSDVFWDGKKFIYRYKVSNGKKAKHAMAFLMLRGLFVVDLPAETLFVAFLAQVFCLSTPCLPLRAAASKPRRGLGLD